MCGTGVAGEARDHVRQDIVHRVLALLGQLLEEHVSQPIDGRVLVLEALGNFLSTRHNIHTHLSFLVCAERREERESESERVRETHTHRGTGRERERERERKREREERERIPRRAPWL